MNAADVAYHYLDVHSSSSPPPPPLLRVAFPSSFPPSFEFEVFLSSREKLEGGGRREEGGGRREEGGGRREEGGGRREEGQRQGSTSIQIYNTGF